MTNTSRENRDTDQDEDKGKEIRARDEQDDREELDTVSYTHLTLPTKRIV